MSAGRDLARLPKAHLHIHLEAALPPQTAQRLAQRHGVPIPPVRYTGDFSGFAGAFLGLVDLLAAPRMLAQVIDEAATDAAAEGVVYLELGVSPHFYADAYGSAANALAAMAGAAEEATGRTGVEVGLMVTVDRTLGAEHAEQTARLAARWSGRRVVSLGLANEERGNPAAPLSRAFAIARDAGLRVTPHAGELVGAEAVTEALDELRPDRIQHGIRAAEDAGVVGRLAREQVCLDVCPTSNELLGVVPGDRPHPLLALLDAGVPCSINADDPSLFSSSILGEYQLSRERIGLSDEQLAACARTSITFSALPQTLHRRAVDGIEAWLREPAS
ncbi:adenosine deaminase [Actinoplanes sp. NBRC 101535]|uniref:adenosine deaminase n=1 Tax=Actinoplanes sp. NBRC 101535 TaxID=3032196 RepID=UPI0024A379EF|nr:adenosine deaminase [Actinoplanes sp. NBRC 101535]GLY06628.1 putative adenosine/adenine deaminase [Actinoplanes sp. NBRC 101535]